jgi:hypothetical protein
MEISYKKNDNKLLFTSMMEQSILNLEKVQNYNPIYERYFSLNETNFNSINLNQVNLLKHVDEKKSNNKYICKIFFEKHQETQKKLVFFKQSPLIDPIQYIIGKLDVNTINLNELPQFNDDFTKKISNPNNSAYVDGFFSYLSSQLLNNCQFQHGLDYYGSFTAIKNDYYVNVEEDLEYIIESDFFHKNKDILFKLDNNFHDELLNFDTRSNKKPISFNNGINNIVTGQDTSILTLSDIDDLTKLDHLFSESHNNNNSKMELLFKSDVSFNNTKKTDESSSECSSNSSDTHIDESFSSDEEIDSDSETETETQSGSDSEANSYASGTTATEDKTNVILPNYPINLICLECCEHTFESLILKEDLSDAEWESAILQIIFILITYQKTFHFTHNDLHTSNIMYIKTDKPFLYYKFNNKHYKVETHGRIFKIIDFGRAIYSFKGKLICSDSFHPKGDAATQYNFEPYFNEQKPRLEPNYSFDLCRLGCSIFDFIIDDLTTVDKVRSPIKKLIISWCYDDKGRNILYKTNGKERYPDFKLYKMIARTVHNYLPQNIVNKDVFNKYIVSKKQIKTKTIMNIDSYECWI